MLLLRRLLNCMTPIIIFVTLLFCYTANAEILTIADINSDMQSLDPQFGGTLSGEGILMELLFNSLVRFPPGTTDIGSMEADLATTWENNDDFTTWSFLLKKGVRFHRGYGELVASDVKYSLERNMTDTSPWRSSYSNVKLIEAPDDYTVRIHLKAPDPFFLLKVNNYRGGFIISQKAIKELGDKFKYKPVGTGPFSFKDYRPRDGIDLVANKEYFRGAPILDGVSVKFMPDSSSQEIALRRGSVDMIVSARDQKLLESLKNAGFDLVRVGPGVPYYLHINQSRDVLKDIRIRRAIQHSISRQDFIQFLGSEQAVQIYGPVTDGYFGYTDDVKRYEYSSQKAKDLLSEAGFPNGITLHAIISESPGYRDAMTLIQEQLRRANIDMKLNVVDHTSFHRSIRNNESDLVLYSFTRPPVADVVLSQFFHSDSIVGKPTAVTNFSHYNKIDNLIEKARIEMSVEKQRQLYKEALQQIMEDAVVVPIVNVMWLFVKRPEVDLGLGDDKRVNSLNYTVPINETTKIQKK